MRRFATLALVLPLAACGYKTWWNPPFSVGNDPNAPVGTSVNLSRSSGHDVAVAPLTPEAGDVWPGPPPPTPTLQDIERSGELTSGPELAVPGAPLQRAPIASPNPAVGSSVPTPSNGQPGMPNPSVAPPVSGPNAANAPPPGRNRAGQVVPLPGGPGVTTGGTNSYQTLTTPGGGSAIIVPNGNGTSTVINPDGTIQTIPTPR